MKSFAEYITEMDFDSDPLLEYPKKGKLTVARDFYFYNSFNPKSYLRFNISSSKADIQKAVDKDIKELGKKKAFKDKVGEMKVSTYPKGTYSYELHYTSRPGGGNRIMSITLPLPPDMKNTDHVVFAIGDWDLMKLVKDGTIKFK